MGTFVRYFVVFLFLPGLYLRPDSGATNMRRDRLTRFVRRRTYVRLHLRTFVRPSVRLSIRLPDSFVRSFIRSFSSIISRRFYIHYNLRGVAATLSSAALLPCIASREPRVMIMNSGPTGWWLIYIRHFSVFYRCWHSLFFLLTSWREKSRVKVCFPVCNQFSIWSYYSRRLLNRGDSGRLLGTFNAGS